MGKSTAQGIILDTCSAIWDCLSPTELKEPTREDWIRIEEGFNNKWNFANCIRALDGKHIQIQAPPKSASLFYNYKGYFSLVLMALVDADYKFTYVDIGDYGSNADGSVFKRSEFGQAFMNDELNIPGPKQLPNFPEGGVLPHVIVADEAFPQRCDLMKPHSRSKQRLTKEQQIFNY